MLFDAITFAVTTILNKSGLITHHLTVSHYSVNFPLTIPLSSIRSWLHGIAIQCFVKKKKNPSDRLSIFYLRQYTHKKMIATEIRKTFLPFYFIFQVLWRPIRSGLLSGRPEKATRTTNRTTVACKTKRETTKFYPFFFLFSRVALSLSIFASWVPYMPSVRVWRWKPTVCVSIPSVAFVFCCSSVQCVVATWFVGVGHGGWIVWSSSDGRLFTGIGQSSSRSVTPTRFSDVRRPQTRSHQRRRPSRTWPILSRTRHQSINPFLWRRIV